MLEHNAMQQHDSCKTCKFVMGGDTAHRQLHCGLSYYQAPAAERKASKFENYPVVSADYVCTHWEIHQ